MKFKDEIKEIRQMLNKIGENHFASSRYDDEFQDGVIFLPKKDSGLNEDIIIDCGETYRIYGHPLCLYIVENEKVYPVLISENPYSYKGYVIPDDIKVFIENNYQLLVNLADMKIDSGDFFDNLKTNSEERLIVEMSNYGPDKTGLPVWVYVDDTFSYLHSGHNGSYRFKFQQDKDVKILDYGNL